MLAYAGWYPGQKNRRRSTYSSDREEQAQGGDAAPAGARLCVDPRCRRTGRRPSGRQLVALFTTRVEPPVGRLPPRLRYLALELAYGHRRAYVDRPDDGPDLLSGDTNQRLGHVELRMIVLWYALEEETPSRLRVPPTF